MGTWDGGLLDNDTAWDGLGDLKQTIAGDIVAFGSLSALGRHQQTDLAAPHCSPATIR